MWIHFSEVELSIPIKFLKIHIRCGIILTYFIIKGITKGGWPHMLLWLKPKGTRVEPLAQTFCFKKF